MSHIRQLRQRLLQQRVAIQQNRGHNRPGSQWNPLILMAQALIQRSASGQMEMLQARQLLGQEKIVQGA
jgi:hypothetical protein